MDAEAVRQLRMVLGWVFLIRGDAVWIVLAYWLDRIVSAGSYHIGWICIVSAGLYQETLVFMCWLITSLMGQMGRMDWMGHLVGQGWDGPTFAGARTGAPSLAPERERHHWLLRGSGLWKVVAGTNCVSAARTRSICVGAAK